MKHLFIPDPHATPDHNNKRFTWLGHLVTDYKPDVVICAGDWADMPSLCSYDKGTKGYEGRRYSKDIDSALEAQELFFEPIRAAKKKLPRFIMLEGNHEHRIERAISTDAAQLDGIISLDDLGYEAYGWEFIRYEGSTPGIINVDGINYAHFFTSGIMNRAISGAYPATALLNKQYSSCSQGHTHILDYAIRTTAEGKHIRGLVGGVYTDEVMGYAGAANALWWRGVTVKHDVDQGQYEPEFISMKMIKERYG